MALFPLATPLKGLQLFGTACKLYRVSFIKLMPLTITLALIMHLFQNGYAYFPPIIQAQYTGICMFLIVFSLPVLAGYIVAIDSIAKGKPFSYEDIALTTIKNFTGLMGVLISMLLIPAIIFAVITAIHLLILNAMLPLLNVYVYRTFLALIIYATFTSKIYAPVLVLTESLDVNSALEKSDSLVKGKYLTTLLYSVYGGAFFTAILTFSLWSPLFIPMLQTNPFLGDILGQIAVVIFSSWSFCLWVTLMANAETKE